MFQYHWFLKWERQSSKKEMLLDKPENCSLNRKSRLLSLQEKEDMRKLKWELKYSKMEVILRLNQEDFSINPKAKILLKKKKKRKKILFKIKDQLISAIFQKVIKSSLFKEKIDFKEKNNWIKIINKLIQRIIEIHRVMKINESKTDKEKICFFNQ